MTGLLLAHVILGVIWLALRLSPVPERRRQLYVDPARREDLELTT